MMKRFLEKAEEILFEDVVEEVDEIEVEVEADKPTSKRLAVERAISKENTMKMAYEYSKDAAFRFPVIPDNVDNDIEKVNHLAKEQRERYRQYRHQHIEKRLIRGYQEKKSLQEIEDVPAYLRRTERPERKHEQVVEQDAEVEVTAETERPVINYSGPDELDRIFRKKDAVHESIERLKRQTALDEPSFQRRLAAENNTTFEKQKPIREEIEVELTPRPFAWEKSAEEKLDETKIEPTYLDSKPSITQTMQHTAKADHASVHVSKAELLKGYVRRPEHKNVDVPRPEHSKSRVPSAEHVKVHVSKSKHSNPRVGQHEIDEIVKMTQLKRQKESFTQDEEKPVAHTSESALTSQLLDVPTERNQKDADWLDEQQGLLEQTFKHFNIDANVVKVTQGPAVTRFEIQPAFGVRVNKIKNLSDDIKLNMAAKDIRIEAPIPGKNTIGIEIPNKFPQIVGLQEVIQTDEFVKSTSPLTIALGLTIEGKPLITNIEKMPHGLIAGATGSGKSVCINTILISLLYKASHEDVKFLLIDPKMVELAPYNGIPHLLSPVITDAKAATVALKWAVGEMEERYNKLAAARVRNIQSYNERMIKQGKTDEKMPHIVIVIDELADLMMVSPQEVEDAICRIAQKARACGIHLLVATQRPSVDVITGLIKANIPTRIAFSVSSQVDSRTIIDAVGAERLLGKGDMLFVENGSGKSLRLQGPFVSDDEIDRVTNHFRKVAEPVYLFEQTELLAEIRDEDEDELLDEIMQYVLDQNQASTSLLQRRFRIGYNRAARLIDTLETQGIISGPNGSKPRDILVNRAQMEALRET